MRYHPRALPLVYPKSNVPAAEQRIAQLQRARDEAAASHELARQTMIAQINRTFHPFELGDTVWLDSKNLKLGYPTRKLAPKREGPFHILEVVSTHAYRLELPNQWHIHPVFHAALLTPFVETETHGANYLNLPPDLIDGQEEHEVEAIIAHKRQGQRYRYLVKWLGYPTSENTWEPEVNLKHSAEILKAYKLKKRL